MSKDFRPWKIDEAQLLPPSVQDYVARDHLSRLIVALVREELDLSAIVRIRRRTGSTPPSVATRCPIGWPTSRSGWRRSVRPRPRSRPKPRRQPERRSRG